MATKDTRTDLAEALTAFLEHTPQLTEEIRTGLSTTIEDAKRGEFHDYKNKKYAAPKAVLYERLRPLAGYPRVLAIIQDVTNGVYDEKPDEEDTRKMMSLLNSFH